jgi:deoxyribodipyrimidine photo-lyase
MTTALVWFRRDLRITDNPALHNAAARHQTVIPVYVDAPDEESPWAPGAASRWWLHHSLTALDQQLRALGAPLILRRGASAHELLALAREAGASAIYWNRRYEPATIARDTAVKATLREHDIDAHSCNGALLIEPWELQTKTGGPYKVFTPFWRSADARRRELQARGRAPLPAPASLRALTPAPRSDALAQWQLLPQIPWDSGFSTSWSPGETGAAQLLDRFCEEAAAGYRALRDFPAEPSTSRLSPHLQFGEISPLQICERIDRELAATDQAGFTAGAEHFIREIGWREFSYHLLYHFPQTPELPLNPRFADFPWRRPAGYADDLKAWQRGLTGIPIVDAGMRELWHTGWMHNRVRMIVASFLTKNLLIPWQRGAEWFWDTLVDADLANNTQGWQWTAGCGADAAPYFRVFNPLLQSAKFDPDGHYLRRWIPELARLPSHLMISPWTASSGELARAGVILGTTYPKPIVDLAGSRERALAAYARTAGDSAD